MGPEPELFSAFFILLEEGTPDSVVACVCVQRILKSRFRQGQYRRICDRLDYRLEAFQLFVVERFEPLVTLLNQIVEWFRFRRKIRHKSPIYVAESQEGL